MAGKTLQLDIKLDGKLDPSVQNAFNKLSSLAQKTQRNMKMAQITQGVNQMAGVAQKMFSVAAKGALIMGGAVAAISAKSIMLASDLQEVQNVVDVTFGKNAEQINAWSKTMLDSYGLSELSAKKYSSTLGAMLKSSGVADDQLLKMSTDMAQLTGDFASFYNLDTEAAFDKIRAGISGETEPLKQIGINMSVANLEAYAMSKGISKAYQKMTQAEQASLRYSYLLKVSADAQGDFNRTQGNFANQLRLAKENVNKLTVSIGEKLLPIVTPMVNKFNDFIKTIPPEKIQEMTDKFAKMAESGLKGIANFVINTVPKIMNAINFVMEHKDGVIAAILGFSAAVGALTIAQIALNIAAYANPYTWIILAAVAAIGLLVAGIYLLWKNWDTVMKWMGDGWNMFIGGMSGAWANVWNGIIAVFKGFVNAFIWGINAVIGGLNLIQFDVPDWVPGFGGKHMGINIPLIPYLAEGATIAQKTLAVIGEAGTETVVPHNNKPRSQALAMTAARGAGLNIGGNTYIYSPQVSGSNQSEIRQILRDGYEDFVSYIERYEKEKGRLSYEPV